MAGVSDCFFCKEYTRERDNSKRIEARNGVMHHEIRALMLKLSWNEISGRYHWGEMTHRPSPSGFDLNYCPECGRRLEND